MPPLSSHPVLRRRRIEVALCSLVILFLAGVMIFQPPRIQQARARERMALLGRATRASLLEQLRTAQAHTSTLAGWMRWGTVTPKDPEDAIRTIQPWLRYSHPFSFSLIHSAEGHDLAFGRFSGGAGRVWELRTMDGKPMSRSLSLDEQGKLVPGDWGPSRYDPRSRPWSAFAQDLQETTWFGPYVYAGAYQKAHPCISCLSPAPDHRTAVVDIMLEEITSNLDQSLGEPWLECCLADGRGQVLVAPRSARTEVAATLEAGRVPTLLHPALRAVYELRQHRPQVPVTGESTTFTVEGKTWLAWSAPLPEISGVQWRLDLLAPARNLPPPPAAPIVGPAIMMFLTLCLLVLSWRRGSREGAEPAAPSGNME